MNILLNKSITIKIILNNIHKLITDYMRPVVTALTPGQVSPVVETPDGYQFFKLLSSQDGGIDNADIHVRLPTFRLWAHGASVL